MRVLIKGAGDLASGIALRLSRCGFEIIMTELEKPTAIRRTVAFSEAVIKGWARVEEAMAIKASNHQEALGILAQGCIPVVVDPDCIFLKDFYPDVFVDAAIAKKNTGTSIEDAPIVIGVGPGFQAGKDCHAVVESMRGHTLGRVIYEGSALPNTAVPGLIGGYAGERVLRAPCDGIFTGLVNIGDIVEAGAVMGFVSPVGAVAASSGSEGAGTVGSGSAGSGALSGGGCTTGRLPVKATISGVLRGILPSGTVVYKGMKSGDVDPRGDTENCYTVSDKALAIAGGVLEAILFLGRPREE